MITKEDKEILKKIIISGENPTLQDALKRENGKIKQSIQALIYANGIPYSRVEADEDWLIFYAGHDTNNLKPVIKYQPTKHILDGDYKTTLEKTYLLITSIENNLNDAIYLPSDLRRNAIEKVKANIGIDDAFYTNILKNW